MTTEVEKNVIAKFDCYSNPSTLGTRWKRWLKSFELFADAQGLILASDSDKNKQRRRAQMLHFAGPDVQDIFYTLENTGEDSDYKAAVDALNAYFIPQVNSTLARHEFRQLKQEENETVSQFVTRLRRAGQDCNYGDDTDNHIRDEVVEKCTSDYLRRKLLEEGPGLTLTRTLELAQQCDKVESQLATMSISKEKRKDTVEANNVNRVHDHRAKKKPRPNKGKGRGKRCYRCGSADHLGRDPSCPAKGKECHKCGGKDHFASVCKTKQKKRKDESNFVGENDSDDGYAFHVTEKGGEATLCACVGGVNLKMLIDSGATRNIVDEQTWEWLKTKHIKCTSKAGDGGKKLYAYATSKPLEVKGTFESTIKIGKGETVAEFVVIKGKGIPLLGKQTATEVGALKIGEDVAAIMDISQVLQRQYPEVFNGVGKLKTRQVKLHIDPEVEPVAQPLRRTPFNLRKKVEDKIEELIKMDIIEEVDGPTPWVNPVVIVPKAKGEIRLCVDMRRANEAIVRERHPIPTVDEILQGVNSSKLFSKLDLKWGYHQLELSPESREITTFATHTGLYRYKRLLFGVNSASEQYQHEISTVIAGIEGAENISDDIVVHGRNQEEHDNRLHAVLRRLQSSGLTLNPEKCLYNMDQIVFMGILLSEKGIGPTAERVRAVVEAREPENVTELKSFLGLVSYSSRFIPRFATLSEPLRRLTRKNERFVFGPEQRESFKALKEELAKATTLAYFDKDADTQVIADASPVGLGAVLVQEQKGVQVPICYASRGLTDCERRYSQTEKEALALVWACEKFHPYIYGKEFDLVTDHKPLLVIYSPRSKPCARIERWTLRLQPYTFRIVHVGGKQNIADSLSRLVKGKEAHDHGAEEYVRFVAVSTTPKAMTTKEIEMESARDEELSEVKEAIKTGKFEKCKSYAPIAGELCVIGQLVLRGTRIVLPGKLRPQALALAHEGHLGVVGTKQNLRSKVWWPGMDRAAERHCRSCHGCQLVAKPDPPDPIKSTTLPEGPWLDVATDLQGPFPSGHSILVVVDYYSRYYEYAIMKSTTTGKVIDALEEMFSRHGLPLTMKSDNGPQFISEEFKAYCLQNGIKRVKVMPKWAQANGEVERQNQSILKRIQIAQAESLDWRKELRKYVFKYRITEHATTGKTPAELLFGRKIRGKLPDFNTPRCYDLDTRDKDAEEKGKAKLYADGRRRAKQSEVEVGDQVLVKAEKLNKFTTNFHPTPYTVIDKTGSNVFVESPSGAQYSRNTTHVKKYFTNPQVEEASDGPNHTSTESTTSTEEPTVAETPGNPKTQTVEVEVTARPRRARRPPERFKDYITP